MDISFFSNLPNRMPYTNPGAISNSGNKYFTNPRSKILKLNLGIIDNADQIINFLNTKLNDQNKYYVDTNTKTNTSTNVDGDLKTILDQQKKYSKNNKLNQVLGYNL